MSPRASLPIAMTSFMAVLLAFLLIPELALADQAYVCRLCRITHELHNVGLGDPDLPFHQRNSLAILGFRAFQEVALRLLALVVIAATIVLSYRVLLSPDAGREAVPSIVGIILVALLARLIIDQGGEALFVGVFDMIQDLAILLATMILQLASWVGAPPDSGALVGPEPPTTMRYLYPDTFYWGQRRGAEIEGGYPLLWVHVEQIGFRIIDLISAQLSESSSWFGGISMRLIAWFILGIPYFFVMGIFGAFLIQVQFYFIAISVVSPFLLIALVFKGTRAWVARALHFLIGGAMTVIFASVAMAFTGMLLNTFITELVSLTEHGNTAFGTMSQAEIAEVNDAAWQACLDANAHMSAGSVAGMGMTPSQYCAQGSMFSAWHQWHDYRGAALEAMGHESGETGTIMGSSAYWAAFLLGFISVLLHLAAPRLASNISGANDSATSAMIVTAAGQFAAAKGISMAGRPLGPASRFASWAAGQGVGRATEHVPGVGGMVNRFLNRGVR